MLLAHHSPPGLGRGPCVGAGQFGDRKVPPSYLDTLCVPETSQGLGGQGEQAHLLRGSPPLLLRQDPQVWAWPQPLVPALSGGYRLGHSSSSRSCRMAAGGLDSLPWP